MLDSKFNQHFSSILLNFFIKPFGDAKRIIETFLESIVLELIGSVHLVWCHNFLKPALRKILFGACFIASKIDENFGPKLLSIYLCSSWFLWGCVKCFTGIYFDLTVMTFTGKIYGPTEKYRSDRKYFRFLVFRVCNIEKYSFFGVFMQYKILGSKEKAGRNRISIISRKLNFLNEY